MKNVELMVSGMSCSHCATTVKSALTVVQGVREVEVSVPDGRATVQVDDTLDEVTLVEAVEQAGYGAAVKAA